MAACRMINTFDTHKSVLPNEVREHLAIKANGIYVDATFGRGGHSQLILDHLGPQGKLYAFDQDPEAIAYAKDHFSQDKRFTIFHSPFSQLKKHLANETGFIDGVLFDLGVSSPQLDNPNRGFSFMRSGKLDMRMDTTRGEDASQWLNTVSEEALAEVLWKRGEERFSRRIARAIVQARELAPIISTNQLTDIISEAIPFREKGKHPATRTFQAIRIEINRELDELEQALEQAYQLLKIGGRLLVISFHSLEDRLVKQFIQHKEQGPELPARLPVKHSGFAIQLKRIGRAIKPSDQEVAGNPRARSAILRIAEKLS